MKRDTRCFPRSHRLLQAADFQFVFEHPGKHSTRHFNILYRRNRLAHARLGLAISKRIIKKAVKRNQLKRFIREGFRVNREYLDAFDIIVLVRKGAAKRILSTNNRFEDPSKLWAPLFRS